MSISPSDLAGALHRCRAVVAAMARQDRNVAGSAGRFADLLLELIPRAGLTACLLGGTNGPLALRPDDRASDPEQLRSQLGHYDPHGEPVQTLAETPSPSLRLLAAAIGAGERVHGFLLVGLPADAAAAERARAETLLSVVGPTLGLCRELEEARAEREELARFALLGQAFAGLAHELNNALNIMMLQTSVVQLRVDEQARQDLAAIRQHGAQAAGLVRSLQQVVQERREQFYVVDLNDVVAEILEDTELRRRVSVQLSGEAPLVQATRSVLKQLLRLALENVCAGTSGTVRVATVKGDDDGAALDVTIAATGGGVEPPPPEELLWRNLDDVGRQAGRSLLRQLGGTLTVEAALPSGWRLRLTWG